MVELFGIAAFLLFLFFVGYGLHATQTISSQVSGLINGNSSYTATGTGGLIGTATVPAAQPATLTTHTTNTTGTLTMTNSSHGITTGQRIDIYWTGGQCYGAVAGTVSGTSVPIASVSGGSNLPSSSTLVTVGIPTSAAFEATGNNITSLACTMAQGVTMDGYFVFASVAPADILAEYVVTGTLFSWYFGNGVTNPLAGVTPLKVWMSHDNTSAAQIMNVTATTN